MATDLKPEQLKQWRFEGNKIAERWATVTSPAKETS
jgi:hypothetical protein